MFCASFKIEKGKHNSMKNANGFKMNEKAIPFVFHYYGLSQYAKNQKA